MCSPDKRTVAGQTLYLFGSSTHGERLFLVPFDSVHFVAQTSQKTHLSFDCHFNSLCVAGSHFFCKRTKIVLGALLISVLFKVAISHPFNPGATPWYIASYVLHLKSPPGISRERLGLS